MTVPFGSFEEALKQKANKDVVKRLEAAIKDIPSTKAEEALEAVRNIVMEVGSLYISADKGLCQGKQPGLLSERGVIRQSQTSETHLRVRQIGWLGAQVQVPEDLQRQLKGAMKDAGIPVPEGEERWNDALKALKVSSLTLSRLA